MLRSWGKAKADETDAVQSHPAAYHMMDVAAGAATLLDNLPLISTRLESMLGPDYRGAVRYLIAIHDLGKFSRSLQAQRPDLWSAEYGDIDGVRAAPRHDALGMHLWLDRMSALTSDGVDLLPLARATFGHHGQPVDEQSQMRMRVAFGAHGIASAESFARACVEIFDPQPVRLDRIHVQRAGGLL